MPLKNCCCCVSLRMGALIIAILYLVGNILSFLSACFTLPGLNRVPRTADSNNAQVNAVYSIAYEVTQAYTIALLVVSLIGIPFNSLLIHGVNHGVRKMALAWLVWYGVLNVLATLLWVVIDIVVLAGLHSLPPQARAPSEIILAVGIVVGGICIVVTWYLYACVVAYYQSEEGNTRYDMAHMGGTPQTAGQK